MAQWWILLTKTFDLFLVLFYLVLVVLPQGYAIVFAYISNMENLLETQAHVIKEIQSRVPYLDKEKKRCVEKYLTRSEIEYSKAVEDTKKFLENPINAYKLVKRLSVDLIYIETITSRNGNKNKRNKNVTYTTEKQLQNANIAILYLTLIYKLNYTELANGILRGNFSKSKQPFTDLFPSMTSTDCLELAMAAYEYEDFELALGWAKEALRKHHEGPDDCLFNELETMLSISLLYNVTGDVKNSLHWLNESKSKGASKTKLHDYEVRVKQVRSIVEEKLKQSKYQQNTTTHLSFLKEVWDDTQVDLCSTERRYYSRLTCQYQYGPHPFLRLARLKAELLHRGPDITIFYDVISDDEILRIQELAKAKFQGKKDKTCEPGYKATKIMRKVACLNDSLSTTLKVVSKRATHISGITSARLTRFTTIDYGVAGFQTVHDDLNTLAPVLNQSSIRFDTVAFYFNEVNQGGATIFTKLNLSVFPVKNSALYFRNLLPSGEQNLNIEHASCPVLHGTKWIGLKRLSG